MLERRPNPFSSSDPRGRAAPENGFAIHGKPATPAAIPKQGGVGGAGEKKIAEATTIAAGAAQAIGAQPRAVVLRLPEPSTKLLVLVISFAVAALFQTVLISAIISNLRYARKAGSLVAIVILIVIISIGVAIRGQIWRRVMAVRARKRWAEALLRGEMDAPDAEACSILAAGAGCERGHCDPLQVRDVLAWNRRYAAVAGPGGAGVAVEAGGTGTRLAHVWIDSPTTDMLREGLARFGIRPRAARRTPSGAMLVPLSNPCLGRHAVLALLGGVVITVACAMGVLCFVWYGPKLTRSVVDTVYLSTFLGSIVLVPASALVVYRWFQRRVAWLVVTERGAAIAKGPAARAEENAAALGVDEATVVVTTWSNPDGSVRRNMGTLWFLFVPGRRRAFVARNMDHHQTPWGRAIDRVVA